jgi:hypothetical protein
MPRFFLDVIDHETIDFDDNGLELADVNEAVQQAKSFIDDLALDPFWESPPSALIVQIRDGTGRPVETVRSFAVAQVAQRRPH